MSSALKFPIILLILLSITTFPVSTYDPGNNLPLSPIDCMQDDYYNCDICPCPLLNYYLNSIYAVYTLAFLASLVLILGYIFSRELRKQPGDFFFILSLAGATASISSLVEAAHDAANNMGDTTSTTFCITIAAITDFAHRIIRCYHVSFIVYFLFSLRFTLKQSSIPRTFYHAVPWLVSAGLTIQLGWTGGLGKAIDGTCGTMSSSSSEEYIIELVLCLVLLAISIYLIKYISAHTRMLGDEARSQIKYYLIYFILANVILLLMCIEKFIEALGMQGYLAKTGPVDYTDAREVVLSRQSAIYIDLINSLGVTMVRVLDPSLRKGWKKVFTKIFFCSKRSPGKVEVDTRNSSLSSELLNEVEKQRIVSMTVKQVKASMRKKAVLVQMQHHNKVQAAYSLLAAIHYYYGKLTQDSRNQYELGKHGIEYYKQKSKEVHKYPIKESLIEEHLPEIIQEIRTRQYKVVDGKLIVYAPHVFGELVQLDKIATGLLASLELAKNDARILKSGLGQGGRGGEFFFFSNDNKIIIKTINSQELQVLLDILPRYNKYFLKHPKSLISKIYGAFTFEVNSPYEKYHFIVMRNVNGYPSFCTERRYDLKGSTVDRCVLLDKEVIPEELKHYGTLKDMDFNKYEGKIHIPKSKQKELFDNLASDVNFLTSQGLIDYSLIVYVVNKTKMLDYISSRISASNPGTQNLDLEESEGVHTKKELSSKSHILTSDVKNMNFEVSNPLISIRSTKETVYYHMGIIDYLGKFTWKKRFEKTFKQFKAMDFDLDVSSQSPEVYSWRFLRYMRSIIQDRKVF